MAICEAPMHHIGARSLHMQAPLKGRVQCQAPADRTLHGVGTGRPKQAQKLLMSSSLPLSLSGAFNEISVPAHSGEKVFESGLPFMQRDRLVGK